MAYYLEDLSRIHDLSMEKLGEWKEQYPYSQMVHFLMAKKHQIEGFIDDMSVYHKASFYAVDRVFLKERMEEAVGSLGSVESLQSAVGSSADNQISNDSEEIDSSVVGSLDSIDSLQSSVMSPDFAEEVSEDAVKENPKVGSGQRKADRPKLEVTSLDYTDQDSEKSQQDNSVDKSEDQKGKLKEEELSPFAKWVNGFESKNIDLKKKKKKKSKKSKLEKKIKESIIKKDEIVSEPLANILAQQGHTEKAKAMYEKLSLIFPEKSSFFALQIEKLINSK